MTDDQQNLHRHRLLMVAKALRESAKPDDFDMCDVLNSCGTPGCAFGHYVYRTDLQDFVKPTLGTFVDTEREFWKPVYTDGGGYASFRSGRVREHFGLTAHEQGELFDGDGCGGAETANEAAHYIERFVAKKYGSIT